MNHNKILKTLKKELIKYHIKRLENNELELPSARSFNYKKKKS